MGRNSRFKYQSAVRNLRNFRTGVSLAEVVSVSHHAVKVLYTSGLGQHHGALSEDVTETRVQDAAGWSVVSPWK